MYTPMQSDEDAFARYSYTLGEVFHPLGHLDGPRCALGAKGNNNVCQASLPLLQDRAEKEEIESICFFLQQISGYTSSDRNINLRVSIPHPALNMGYSQLKPAEDHKQR
jgi:hypothetical protein